MNLFNEGTKFVDIYHGGKLTTSIDMSILTRKQKRILERVLKKQCEKENGTVCRVPLTGYGVK